MEENKLSIPSQVSNQEIFCFQLTESELQILRFQIGTSNHRRHEKYREVP